VGSNFLEGYEVTENEVLVPAIKAPNESVSLTPRNANGGLWYYNSPTLSTYGAYRILSALEGMFGYAEFAVRVASFGNASTEEALAGLEDAVYQLKILYSICRRSDTGLPVHGYDAFKEQAWVDPTTGASPVVYGRALAFYTLSVANTLSTSQALSGTKPYVELQNLLVDVVEAQLDAYQRGLDSTGQSGVWQVVDRPGASGNYIEASASFLTVYSFLRSARFGYLERADCKDRNLTLEAITAAGAIYQSVKNSYLAYNTDGSLAVNGTSPGVTWIGQNINYEYYVAQPVYNKCQIPT
jgi:rhamnogalacturonyl hydrolase YesR